jgi:hypothetical protein
MKTIIAGSRSMRMCDVESAISACLWAFDITEVVSGCAQGADRCGERWADVWKIPIKRFPADWKTHGKAAGVIRNRQMAEYADALIAVYDGTSPGTAHMIITAKGLGLQVFVWTKKFFERGAI